MAHKHRHVQEVVGKVGQDKWQHLQALKIFLAPSRADVREGGGHRLESRVLGDAG